MKKQLDVLTERSAPKDPTSLRVRLDWAKAALVLLVYFFLFNRYRAQRDLIGLNSQLSSV